MQVARRDSGRPRIGDATTLLDVTRAPSTCIISFFEARDRLSVGFEGDDKEFEKSRKVRKVRALRLPSAERFDRLELSVHWLLAASAVVYLLFEILGR